MLACVEEEVEVSFWLEVTRILVSEEVSTDVDLLICGRTLPIICSSMGRPRHCSQILRVGGAFGGGPRGTFSVKSTSNLICRNVTASEL